MSPRTTRRLIAALVGAVVGLGWWLYEHNQAEKERLLRELRQEVEAAEQAKDTDSPRDR